MFLKSFTEEVVDHLNRDGETIALILGDYQYYSRVWFIIGGNREDKIDKIVDILYNDSYRESYIDNIDWGKYADIVDIDKIRWEGCKDNCLENALKTVFRKDITAMNNDMSQPQEMFYYISVQPKDKWFLHFEYLSGFSKKVDIVIEDIIHIDK